jgi:5-methylthioribose kinase
LSGVYAPLTSETLAERLGSVAAITARLGGDTRSWRAREVGDGNLNLVFIVESGSGAIIVKQALPYVRMVGESWPLPLKRTFFEFHALTRQEARDPGRVPAVYHFDEAQSLIVMEYLSPHVILRRSLIAGVTHPGLGEQLGAFVARTAFRGSDLHMPTAKRKADLALFADNVSLSGITEDLVFTDPYFAAPLNRHTSPELDGIVAEIRADVDLKVAAQHLKLKFCAHAECRVIDPEFALYGPFGFDLGMLIGNFLMAFFAQSGHESRPGERDAYREWILGVAATAWDAFAREFTRLWNEERTGILYPRALYEDQGHGLAADQAMTDLLHAIWHDAVGFAGMELHRRVLGLAHIAEFEQIDDTALRAKCETKALRLGRYLAVNRASVSRMDEIQALAWRLERGEVS